MPDQEAPLVLKFSAGRTFRPAENTTFEHDLWMMQEVNAAGLGELPSDRKGKAVIAAVLHKVIASGRTMHLLAGSLIEDDVPWSPAAASEAAHFFSNLTDPADKQLLHAHLVEILALFFVSAGRRSGTSENSSGGKTIRGSSPIEAASASATGPSSSGNSQGTTRTGTRKSSGGRSGKGSSRTSSK